MKKITGVAFILFSFVILAQFSSYAQEDWAMNATIIEACSCPMFCQCYFNLEPAAHGGHGGHGEGEHFCRFNNAFQVNKGNYGNVKLDGIKFWVAGDLGGDFSMGQMDWAELTFDKSVTKEQRDAVAAILAHVYPVKWNSFTVGEDAVMEWNYNKDRAVAKLNEGKTAEVVLNRFKGMTDDPIVISNLVYWGVPRNDGFIMMPNEVQAYRVGGKPFEFKGTNGFMITFDITSKDVSHNTHGKM
ncbi:MAG TPA: DUF1326 domain-containing protein [Ignavibacteriaceae bacterium]|jgi:hypothetical protein